jgi:hypothetical protein
MRTITLTAILLASSLTSLIHAAPQGGNLVQQLQSTYIPNVLDASGIKVAQAGSILVVQLDGVQANPRGRLSQPFANSFADGQIQMKGGLGTRIPFGGPRPSMGTPRTLASGEKVYLLKTEVKDNNIIFVVQSCGTCNPKSVDPAHQPYRAEVDFKFIKGALAGTDFKSVQGVIEQVFKFQEAEADTGTGAGTGAEAGGAPPPAAAAAPRNNKPRAEPTPQPQPEPEAPPAQKFADIPPPPAPPAAPKKIALGQTLDEVKANFGDPEQILDLGTKVIYKYKDLKVTFLKGKVTDVE